MSVEIASIAKPFKHDDILGHSLWQATLATKERKIKEVFLSKGNKCM
jgi:hypothetical protein